MNSKKHKLPKRLLAMLLTITMFVTMFPAGAFAAPNHGGEEPPAQTTDSLHPGAAGNDDVTIEKSAERIGADTWQVTMNVTAKEKPLQPIPVDVALVIDGSDSMNKHEKLRDAKMAARGLVDQFANAGVDAQIGVISYNDFPGKDDQGYDDPVNGNEADLAHPMCDLTSLANAESIKSAIDKIKANGATNMQAGMDAAIEMLNSGRTGAQKVIIFLADGDYGYAPERPACSERFEHLYDTANGFKNTQGNEIFTVAFAAGGAAGNTLKNLANPGNAYTSENYEELVKNFEAIAAEVMAMVYDPMGDDVHLVEGNRSATLNGQDVSDGLSESKTGALLWNTQDDQGIPAGETLTITYQVQLNSSPEELWKKASDGSANVSLNGDARLNYSIGGEDREPLHFNIPTDTVELAKLTVAKQLDDQNPKATGEEDYVFIWPDAQEDLKWDSPDENWRGGEYTGSTMTLSGNDVEDFDENVTTYTPSVAGEYSLVHHYATQPVAPEVPNISDLFGDAVVTIQCDNDSYEHQDATYDLLDKSYQSDGEVTQGQDGKYYFNVTISPELYVDAYNNEDDVINGGKTHSLVEGQKSQKVTFVYDEESEKWNPTTTLPIVFKVKCADPLNVTDFTKSIVASEDAANKAGIDNADQYAYPNADGKVIIPNGEKVTLLYALTVKGDADAGFTVTDEGATLVKGDVEKIDNAEKQLTVKGTIPENGTLTFYVAKEFSIEDINDKGMLVNQATIEPDEGTVEPSDPNEETPAEPEVPDIPGLFGDAGVAVRCDNENYTHKGQTYKLLDGSYTVSDMAVQNGQYSFDVTVVADKYVDAYNGDEELSDGMHHDLTSNNQKEKTVTFVYDKASGQWAPKPALPITFVVKCADPEYSLTYDPNGGKFYESGDALTVNGLKAGEQQLWTKKGEGVKPNVEGIEWPTHDQANAPEGSLIAGDGTPVSVVMMGWTTDEKAQDKIYASGEQLPEIATTVTLNEDNKAQTVYAVWGYDENGDGAADAQQIIITPADITIYEGGDGYNGIVDKGGAETGNADNGLAEPGYYLVLPYALNEHFGGADVTDDLSGKLLLHYEQGSDERNWELKLYNEEPGANNQVPGDLNHDGVIADGEHYNVYKLVPVGENQHPVRLEVKMDDGSFVTTDAINFNIDSLFEEYNMRLYNTDGFATTGVTAYLSVNESGDELVEEGGAWKPADEIIGENTVQGIARGYGKLTIRGASDASQVSEIAEAEPSAEVGQITAVADASTEYNVNDSDIPVVGQENGTVQLLDDAIVSDSDTNAMLEDAIMRENSEITSDYTFDFHYLDLVDTANGHAYATLADGDEVTLFWPYPEGMDMNDTFYIAHFDGLDRNYDANSLNDDVLDDSLKMYTEDGSGDYKLEKTENGIKFTTSSFSPFALVYDNEGSGTIDPPPVDPGEPGGGGDNPPALNTEDHFSYVVGYEDGMVKPQRNITRAEVSSIFYRLLEDEVRDDNTTDVSDFSDVSASDWYGTTVATLSKMGIVKGYEDGTFRPNAPITRAEFAAIATRFFEETGAEYEPGTFTDVSGDEWFAGAIQDAVNLGLIGGYEDGSVRPNNNITRAEACAIVNRTLGRVPDADHLLPTDEMKTWPDNQPSDWFYADMQEATNGHEYEWITEDGNKVEEWTKIMLDNDWEDR